MKTTISKDIKHSLLINESDLLSLCNFLSQKFKKVAFSAKCVDGSQLETDEIKEIISFDNPNYRKIRFVSISGYNDYDEKLHLFIWTDSSSTSAEFQIESNSDETATYILKEILNRLNEIKPWYDLLARFPVSYFLLGSWFIWGMWGTFMQVLGRMPPSATLARYSIVETINILVLFTLVVIAITYPINRFQEFLFPKVFLLLGKQTKTMESINKWRNFIFKGIIFAIIIGVIGNVISTFILK